LSIAKRLSSACVWPTPRRRAARRGGAAPARGASGGPGRQGGPSVRPVGRPRRPPSPPPACPPPPARRGSQMQVLGRPRAHPRQRRRTFDPDRGVLTLPQVAQRCHAVPDALRLAGDRVDPLLHAPEGTFELVQCV